MKEQERGEGSDSKDSLRTKSDESGEERNGDEDFQRAGQKKKGEWSCGSCEGSKGVASPVTFSHKPADLQGTNTSGSRCT